MYLIVKDKDPNNINTTLESKNDKKERLIKEDIKKMKQIIRPIKKIY